MHVYVTYTCMHLLVFVLYVFDDSEFISNITESSRHDSGGYANGCR